MSRATLEAEAVVPAQLSFLALYNPSLSHTDETLHDQVVYYYSSKLSRAQRSSKGSVKTASEQEHEDQNERSRQIGLAQGMVAFAKPFSDGEAIDAVESEKSRILLHELEPGWWILASIDLTRLQSTPSRSFKSSAAKDKSGFEYSSREVCPQALLLQHLLRAHSIFLLHHAPTLEGLYTRLSRPKFCDVLAQFWSRFVRTWSVLLHGNPAVDVYNGVKLAAGGELGIGVGEEEWGSGEREVLEGFIDRTEGLVDLVVSRFNDPPSQDSPLATGSASEGGKDMWLGSGRTLKSSDGVVFSGRGAITRSSLKSISAWMEWIYRDGRDAYGVQDSSHSARRKRRRKPISSGSFSKTGGTKATTSDTTQENNRSLKAPHSKAARSVTPETYPNIPPPLVTAPNQNLADTSSAAGTQLKKSLPSENGDSEASGADTLIKIMTLGIYGSNWGIQSGRPFNPGKRSGGPAGKAGKADGSQPLAEATAIEVTLQGTFLIGLPGDPEDEDMTEDEGDQTETKEGLAAEEQCGGNKRLSHRTAHVERRREQRSNDDETCDDAENMLDPQCYSRLRVIVYIRQPFIFTFLFEPDTHSLALPAFYRSIHHQLGPLQRPLVASTDPSRVFERLWEAAAPKSTTTAVNSQPIYDLVYDPASLTVHTTIPSIPEVGTATAEGIGPAEAGWTRMEALNVHSQILHSYISNRRQTSELERTSKTQRGWWVVWMRLPGESDGANTDLRSGIGSWREAFLVRRASDQAVPIAGKVSALFGRNLEAENGWGAGKLAEGVGIDARRYIEGLLSLNR